MARKTSFYYAFLVLPAEQRRAVVAVWDFCRAVDDAVDEFQRAAKRPLHVKPSVSGAPSLLGASMPSHRRPGKVVGCSRSSSGLACRVRRSTT